MRAGRLLTRIILIAPKPAQGIGKSRSAMFSVVAAIAKFELVVVSGKFERRSHLLIRQRPTPMQVIQIIRAILQKYANRLFRRPPNERGIIVSTANVREAADMAQHSVERVRPLPRNGPGANSARTNAANRPAFGIFRDAITLLHRWQNFFHEKPRVEIPQRIVLVAPIAPRLLVFFGWRNFAGIHK